MGIQELECPTLINDIEVHFEEVGKTMIDAFIESPGSTYITGSSIDYTGGAFFDSSGANRNGPFMRRSSSPPNLAPAGLRLGEISLGSGH